MERKDTRVFMRGTFYASALLSSIMLLSAPAFAGEIERELEMEMEANPGAEIPVIVTFRGRLDTGALKERDKGRKRREVKDELKKRSDASKTRAREALSRRAKRYGDLWISNGLALNADPELIRELASMPEVESVKADAIVHAPPVSSGSPSPRGWNLGAVQAPEMWSRGHRGRNVVVAVMDTGVDMNHPGLASGWRGGVNSWFDPNGEHLSPYDASGHGTQVTGLITGAETGVAPEAGWVAVKIFNDSGLATLSGIHLGFQWLLDPDGNPLTDDAPDLVNNSWGLDNINGCSSEFDRDIEALRAAGIAVVFSSGNAGPGAQTSSSPANFSGSLSVGATDEANSVASFSGRGPAPCGNPYYPLFSAPGQNVRTTDLTYGGTVPDSYTFVSGTSFSSAHLSGAIALVASAAPGSTAAAIQAALASSALDLGEPGPDNAYGAGLIRAYEALNRLKASGTADGDGDGYPASSDCNDMDASVHPGAPEVKGDGIDQDCNGYDLSIKVVRAYYNSRGRSLRIDATSALGSKAALAVSGYGPMRWNRRSSMWTMTVKRLPSRPGSVTVTGAEGSESAPVR